MGGEAGVTRNHAILRTVKVVEGEDDESDYVPKNRTSKKKISYAEMAESSPREVSPVDTVSSPSPPRPRPVRNSDSLDSIDLASHETSPVRSRSSNHPVFEDLLYSPSIPSSPPALPSHSPSPPKRKRVATARQLKESLDKRPRQKPVKIIELSSSPIASRYPRIPTVSKKSAATRPEKKKKRRSSSPFKEVQNVSALRVTG